MNFSTVFILHFDWSMQTLAVSQKKIIKADHSAFGSTPRSIKINRYRIYSNISPGASIVSIGRQGGLYQRLGFNQRRGFYFFDHQFAHAFVGKISNWRTEDDEIISFLAKFFQKKGRILSVFQYSSLTFIEQASKQVSE